MTAVLFDLDGTLLNTLEDLKNSVNHTLRHFGCPERSTPEVRAFVGSGARNLVSRSLPGKPDDPALEQALAVYQAHYAIHSLDTTAPYPGILEALEQVRAICPVGIVSNKPDAAVKSLAERYFPGVYALGQRPEIPHKPAPDMLALALKELGCDSCIYVGDSDVDVITANNAGAPCISVTWGFRDADVLLKAGARHLCKDAAELAALVKAMLKGK